MHTPEHLMQQAKDMRLDGLYPDVREVLRAIIMNLAVIERDLMAKAVALEGLPDEVEERVRQLEELTVKHNELYAIHQAMRVRADNEHAVMTAAMQANKDLIVGLNLSFKALEMDLEDVAAADAPLKDAIDKVAVDIAALKASTTSNFTSLATAINGKKAFVAPVPSVADVAGAALKADYSVVGALVSTLAQAMNATNLRVNEDTAKINSILAALRTHGIIMS